MLYCMNNKDEDFNFEETFDLSNFDFNDESKKGTERKIIQIYWHEIGHLIGKFICNELGFDIGETEKIDFSEHYPHILNPNIPEILMLKSYGPIEDYYGEENGSGLDECNGRYIKYKNKEFDTAILSPYLLYIFAGGFFNLYINANLNNKLVIESDFDKIFKNIESDQVDRSKLDGCAGDDWRRIKEYCSPFEIPLGEIKKFRLSLYQKLENYNFFEYFKSQIDKIFSKNIEIFTGIELRALELEVFDHYNCFPKRDGMISELKNLTDNFCLNNIS